MMPAATGLFRWLLRALLIHLAQSFALSISPNHGAFLLQRLNQPVADGNTTRSTIYVHNGCVYNTEQLLTARIGEQSYSLPLYPSMQNLYCSLTLKVVKTQITLEQPYVDILVYRDQFWTNTFKQKLCVNVELRNQQGKVVYGSCSFDEEDSFRHTCLIRQEIPFTWFQVNDFRNDLGYNELSVLYSAGTTCSPPRTPLRHQKIQLTKAPEQLQTLALDIQETGQLSLMVQKNLSFTPGSFAPMLLHLYHNNNDNGSDVLRAEVKVWIDSRLEIASASPLAPEKWSLKVMSVTPPTFHTTLALTKVENARRQMTDEFLVGLLFKAKSNAELTSMPHLEDGKVMSLHWSVQLVYESGERSTETRTVTKIPIKADSLYAIAPMTRNADIINTAVISGVQVATPMRVFSISEGAQVREITDKAHCISAEPRLLKTSPTCTSVYVDGSEMRGNSKIEVHIQYRSLVANALFTVWYPKLPITVWVSDSVLNTIADWNVAAWQDLPVRRRRSRDARQFTCRSRFQQTEIRVLAAYHIVDEETGDRTYLSGDRNLLFDVTQVAANRIQSSDPSVLVIEKKNGRLIGVPKRVGLSRLVIKALAPAIDYGSVGVVVTDDQVVPTQLQVRPVANAQLQLVAQPHNPVQYELVTRVQSVFTGQYQHGSAEMCIFYSDGQREFLADIDSKEFSLSVYSSDDLALRVTQQKSRPSVELIVLGAGGDVTLTVELHNPTYCEDADASPIVVGHAAMHMFFNLREPGNARLKSPSRSDLLPGSNFTSLESASTEFNLQPVLLVLLTLIFVIGFFQFITHNRGLHNGYEKLVVPLLAKFSSSHSIASDKDGAEEIQEWVWMSKEQLDNRSIESRYSQRSTLEMGAKSQSPGSLSAPEHPHKNVAISYRGSEVSVFIAPQPAISVHDNHIMSASLHLEDSPGLKPKAHHRYCDSNALRDAKQQRRVSENFVHHRKLPVLCEPYYQSVGHARRSHNFETGIRNVPTVFVPNGVQRPRLTVDFDGMRESIA